MAEEVADPTRYKVVELTTVTDEAIEQVLNEWSAKGFTIQGMHFAMRESSKRPAMAFLVFNAPTPGGKP